MNGLYCAFIHLTHLKSDFIRILSLKFITLKADKSASTQGLGFRGTIIFSSPKYTSKPLNQNHSILLLNPFQQLKRDFQTLSI